MLRTSVLIVRASVAACLLVTLTDGTPLQAYNSEPEENLEELERSLNDERRSTAPVCGKPVVKPRLFFASPFIVGGWQAKPHSWPWQCRLFVGSRRTGRGSLCGASVVDSRHVLTAAHCVVQDGKTVNADNVMVTCGDHYRNVNVKEAGEQVRLGTRVDVHRSYNIRQLDSDVAVVRLDSALTFNEYIQPVCLPSKDVPADSECFVTGWGRLETGGSTSDTLQQVTLPIVSQSACKQRWGRYLTDNMLCAGYTEGGRSSCQGDSGGPYVCRVGDRWELHGVVSFGHRDCAAPNFPSVFTRVTSFTSWIRGKVSV
jgi:secreted trypsin-like serine protease